MPSHQINPYLNSTARINNNPIASPDWKQHLRNMWLSQKNVFTPCYFNGISKTREYDSNNIPVFVRDLTEFDRTHNTPHNCSGTYTDEQNYKHLKN